MKFLRRLAKELILRWIGIFFPRQLKGYLELRYWKNRLRHEGELKNAHYKYFFTSYFDLSEEDWTEAVVLDIGCGPRGSLEWADMTKERYGLDPLAKDYLKLGADKHKMKYVSSGAEKMPFTDQYFDIITSFNNIDQVDDLQQSVREIKRSLKLGGLFLFLTYVGHHPTLAEPIELDFEIVKRFLPEFELLNERHYEKLAGGLYESILEGTAYDHANKTKRHGILSAKFGKIGRS